MYRNAPSACIHYRLTLIPPDTIVTAVVVRIRALIAGSEERNLQNHFIQ